MQAAALRPLSSLGVEGTGFSEDRRSPRQAFSTLKDHLQDQHHPRHLGDASDLLALSRVAPGSPRPSQACLSRVRQPRWRQGGLTMPGAHRSWQGSVTTGMPASKSSPSEVGQDRPPPALLGATQGSSSLRPVARVACLGKVYVISISCPNNMFQSQVRVLVT